MGQLDAPEPKKETFNTPSISVSSTTKPNSAYKHKDKKRCNGLNKIAQDLRDKPVDKKIRLPPSRQSLSPIADFDGLILPSSGTPSHMSEGTDQAKLERMCGAVRTLLECVGENPKREGLLATPSRYAKALLFLTKGYEANVDKIVNNALFHEGHNEMVIVKDIEIYSMCEHHLMPFTGKVNSM